MTFLEFQSFLREEQEDLQVEDPPMSTLSSGTSHDGLM